MAISITTGDGVNVVAQSTPVNVNVTVEDQYGNAVTGINSGTFTYLIVYSSDTHAQINATPIPSAGCTLTLSNSKANFTYYPESVNNQDAQEAVSAMLSMPSGNSFVNLYGSNAYYVWFNPQVTQIRPEGPIYVGVDQDGNPIVGNCPDGDTGYAGTLGGCSNTGTWGDQDDPFTPQCGRGICPSPFVGLNYISSSDQSTPLCSTSVVVQQLSFVGGSYTFDFGGYTFTAAASIAYNSFPNGTSQTFDIDDYVFGAAPLSINYWNTGDTTYVTPTNAFELSDMAETALWSGYSPSSPCENVISNNFVYWRFSDGN